MANDNRYEVWTGKFGPYFRDLREGRDMALAEVLSTLNQGRVSAEITEMETEFEERQQAIKALRLRHGARVDESLEEFVGRLAKEIGGRVYYQNIVFAVCNVLDRRRDVKTSNDDVVEELERQIGDESVIVRPLREYGLWTGDALESVRGAVNEIAVARNLLRAIEKYREERK